MNSITKSEENSTIPEILLEGLLLDISILDALLKRHRCSHGRTIYFRRMSMALNRLLRTTNDSDGTSRKMMIITDMVSWLEALQMNIRDYNREQKNKHSSKKRRHNEEQEQWDLQSLRKPAENTVVSPSQRIVQDFKELIRFWTSNIPKILSRIQHASKSLFMEVSRGFFLPFCAVALGALARIRSLLMEIGIRGLTNIRSLSEEALQMLPHDDASSLRTIIDNTDFEHTTNRFLENDNSESERKRNFLLKSCSTQDVPVDREAILRSLGLTESTKGKSKSTAGKRNDSDIDADDNKLKANDTAIDSTSNNDFFTLSSAAPDGANDVDMDEGARIDNDKLPSSHDSLDRNMALVNQFQKQKVAEKQSKKKTKKSKKASDDSMSESNPKESERKSNKRKNKKKESSKPKKKKKKDKSDFFDSIFD